MPALVNDVVGRIALNHWASLQHLQVFRAGAYCGLVERIGA